MSSCDYFPWQTLTTAAHGSCMNYKNVNGEADWKLTPNTSSKFLVGLVVQAVRDKNEPTTQPSFKSLAIEGTG